MAKRQLFIEGNLDQVRGRDITSGVREYVPEVAEIAAGNGGMVLHSSGSVDIPGSREPSVKLNVSRYDATLFLASKDMAHGRSSDVKKSAGFVFAYNSNGHSFKYAETRAFQGDREEILDLMFGSESRSEELEQSVADALALTSSW